MNDKIREMSRRKDLSSQLIHFTRNNDDADAFEVLKNIISDGFLKCSWSVRNGKNTIFGDAPAVCFTEMPLFAFHEYVDKRNDFSKISNYGIALSKNELFKKGARNVIYGLSNDGEFETRINDKMFVRGLDNNEQYRYMLTDIGNTNDWTHEREWRWKSRNNENYLPIWKFVQHDRIESRHPKYNWDTIYVLVEKKCRNECRIRYPKTKQR